jgi:hypothetical protein
MTVARRTRGRRTQTSNGGNRGRCGQVARQTLWDLAAVVPECRHNFCDMARTLRMGENTFRRPCDFKELRVVKRAHIATCALRAWWQPLYRMAEQIFPRDSVQRNCFELALYTTRNHDCISNRIGSGFRNCPRCRCRLAALPTPSKIERAITMLTDHRFWGHASGPSSSGKTLPSFHPLLVRPCRSPQRPTARAV